MKATQIFAAAVMALALVAMPAEAQSHKDKKAAKKEAWEQEQRQQREEDQLRHQLRMDSIANAQKAAKEKAEKEEADRRRAEAEAKAKQKREEEAKLLEEKEFNEPCSDYISSVDVIYGRGIGEDFDSQFSNDIARTEAIEELASQLSTKVQSLVSNYKKQTRKNLNRESLGRIEKLTMTEVDQTTSFRIACRKTVTYVQQGERIFKTYMVVELNEELLLKPIYNGIQRDEELKIDADYQQFKKEFDEHYKNAEAEEAE